MAYFEWNNDYSVGIAKIDDQHKMLLKYINELYEAMQAGKGRDVLGTVLKNLVDYTRTHFALEERLMQEYGYPDYKAHSQKHNKVTEHVLDLKLKFDTGEISSPIQVTNFLKEWLTKHILGTDKK